MLKPRGEISAGERSLVRLAAIGLTIGVLAGFLGVGGGFLIVPALVVIARLGARQAIAASLGVITLNSIAGIAGHLATVELPGVAVGSFVLAAVAGIWLGTTLTRHLSEMLLRRAFGWTVIAIAIAIAGSMID